MIGPVVLMGRKDHRPESASPVHERKRVELNGSKFYMPVHFPDVDVFMAMFPASIDHVRDLLPSDALMPVRWMDGSALVAVSAMRINLFAAVHDDGTLRKSAPLGAVLGGVLVSRSPLGRGPLTFSSGRMRRHQVGVLELLFPMTSPGGTAVGREGFAEPKFVADLAFLERRGERGVTVTENGRHLLTFAIRPGGPVMRFSDHLSMYMEGGGQLLQMRVPSHGHRQMRLGSGAALLQLGDHPAVAPLKELGIGPEPVLTTNYLDYAYDQYMPEPIGPCTPLPDYENGVELGRYTVDYEGLGALDLHAGYAEEVLRGYVLSGAATDVDKKETQPDFPHGVSQWHAQVMAHERRRRASET